MPETTRPPIGRRLLAEFLGSALLVAVVVGSGIAAQQLSPNDVGLQLLENSTATFLGLTVLILLFGPVSGAHFNPVVSLADWFLGRRTGHGLPLGEVGGYAVAQVAGAVAGAVLANLMFGVATTVSTKDRTSGGHLLAEVVATTFLLALIFALARTGRGALAAPAVGAYIGAAYWFTSSTSFANPAVTVGRVFSDTFAGIAPGSAGAFVAVQLVGLVVGTAVILALYPDVSEQADDVVLPWQRQQRESAIAAAADEPETSRSAGGFHVTRAGERPWTSPRGTRIRRSSRTSPTRTRVCSRPRAWLRRSPRRGRPSNRWPRCGPICRSWWRGTPRSS